MNFWNLFRLIFVIFFLFLMGDAFYRWDGFRYYASFLEFIPSISLISILWIIISVLTTIIVWLLLTILNRICICLKLRVSNEHILLITGFIVFIGAILWTSKKIICPDVQITNDQQLVFVLSGLLISIFLTWLLRNKAEILMGTINNRITPLVWLFGIIVALSLPVVIFYALLETPDRTIITRTNVSSEVDKNRPNIILVTFDALTAKNMSVYGYNRQTTPFISEWANSAIVFNKCQASANATYETVPSLMTGKRVWSHRRYHSDAGKPDKIETENFPLLLKNNGYFNMAFTANEIASVKKLGMSGSFHFMPSPSETVEPASLNGFLRKSIIKYFADKIKLYDWILKEDFILGMLLNIDSFKYPIKTEYPVRKVFDMFLSEINNNQQEPFFAWMHLFPPHAPYLPPDEYVGFFEPSPKYRDANSQYSLINKRYFNEEQQPDASIMKGRYDEFIKYCDNEFEYLITQLSLNNKLKNTVIILSSDHGESFDHGIFTHGSQIALYEEMTHIPLIVKEPINNKGRKIDFTVEMTDIPATILDFANISVPTWMEGRSLLPLIRGNDLKPRPVFSMFLEEVPTRGQVKINKGIVAVWEGEYKLIHNIANKETLLFNLSLDPNELNNLFSTDMKVGKHLLSLIHNNLEIANARILKED